MSSVRQLPSRWGIVSRLLLLVGAIVLGLGLFFSVLVGALSLRAHWQRQADAAWRRPVEDPAEVARRNALALGTPAAALAPQTQPVTVERRVPQPIALWAQTAKLSGSGVALGGKTDRVIGEWRGGDARATWPVDPAAGEYYVDVTYALRPGEGGPFTVAVGGQTLKGTAAPAPRSARGRNSSSSRTSFITIRLGTVKLAEGPTRVEVRPDGPPKNALMSLLRVDLLPPDAPGASAAVAMAKSPNQDGGAKAALPEGDGKRTLPLWSDAKARQPRAAERTPLRAEQIEKFKQMALRQAAVYRQQKEARETLERERKKQGDDKLAAQALAREAHKEPKGATDAAKPPKAVEGFLLVDAASGRTIEQLSDGATINLAALPRGRLTIVAKVGDAGGVGSVRFALDGNASFRTEEDAPYAVSGGGPGGAGGAFAPLAITPGKHTLTATSFSGPGATGAAAKPATLTFTAVDAPK
jgi:hypothetical protein